MTLAARKRVLLLGATGSIGGSALDVIREHLESFQLVGASANANEQELRSIQHEFSLKQVVLASEDIDSELPHGRDAILELVADSDYDLLINALMGNSGIEPTMTALSRGIDVALANKETIVAAGPLVLQCARDHDANVIPIDSEHSAILQCIVGENSESIRRIWLTTSGGPFWGKSPSELEGVTAAQALDHPRWKMGSKITIDSATLLNKGFEVIETQRLFSLPVDSIGVVRHGEHVIHSFVEFIDGSFKAQLGTPDMRIPILYAMTWPKRLPSSLVTTDPQQFGALHFEPVAIEDYPCLELAYDALRKGGDAPAALSAADEVAVQAFLSNKIRFNDIHTILSRVLADWKTKELDSLETVLESDKASSKLARSLAKELQHAGASAC